MTQPKVSIIVISHRVELLKECLDSIERQNYMNIEVLVHHTLKDPHTQMIENGKINRLVEASVGEYVSVICEDDEYEPSFVNKTVDAIETEKVDMVYTDRITIGAFTKHMESGEFTRDAYTSSIGCPLPGTVLVSRDAWESVQGYTACVYSDAHFTWKLCKYGMKAYHLREPLFIYRVHNQNRSNFDNHTNLFKQYYKENPELMEKLNPTDPKLSLWQSKTVTELLNHFYGDKVKWPKYAQLLLEPQKAIQ